MSLKPYVTALAAFTVFLLALGVAASAATVSYQDTAGNHTVTGEQLTVDYSNTSQVSPAGDAFRYQDDEVVRNASGSQLTEGTDYDWNTSTGEVTWYDTAATSDGETATITYTYYGHGELAGNQHSIQQQVFELLPWLVFLLAAFGVLGLFAGAAYLLGNRPSSIAR